MSYVVINNKIIRKFNTFLKNGRILYFFAPCGFGKTTVAKELLKNKKYTFICPNIDEITPDVFNNDDIFVIDDMQNIQSDSEKQILLDAIRKNADTNRPPVRVLLSKR